MALNTYNAITLLAGYAGITFTFIAPLYILVVRKLSGIKSADAERAHIDDEIGEVADDMKEVKKEVVDMRVEVQRNAERSDENQRHIHQILLGDYHGEDSDMGNPHYKAEYCPLPDECPYHEHAHA